MPCVYATLIQTALDSNVIDITRLTETCKDELDVISKNISKSWAPFKATVVSVIAKIVYPDWDTRKHQIQLGGKCSLRTVDKYVSNYLYKKGLYDTPTEFALTRSFEKAEPYDKRYSGMISPKECKTSFLNIVETINTKMDTDLLNDALVYLMTFLKGRKDTTTTLKNSIVISLKYMNILDVSNVLDKLHLLGAGSSKLPVIAVFTLLKVIQPYQWQSFSICPLKEHTEADKGRSYGDVEAYGPDSKPKIAIEVKHLISIDETISLIFDRKTEGKDIPLKFLLTTAKMTHRFTPNNICIDTVNGFITRYLQMTLVHEKNICSIFLQELQNQIVHHDNLNLNIKQLANEILTSHLVEPSP